MTIENAIRHAESTIDWLNSNLNGVQIPATKRGRIAGGCLYLALEHHRAIVLLVSRRMPGSAHSLIRVLIDSYIRGLWTWHCATDDEVNDYDNVSRKISTGERLNFVKKKLNWDENDVKRIKQALWDRSHDYVHSGTSQIVRYQGEDFLEANFSDEELQKVIYLANWLGSLAALGFARLAQDDALAARVYAYMRDTLVGQENVDARRKAGHD